MFANSKNIFQCRMVYLFASLSTLGITPIAIARVFRGELLNAALDVFIILAAVYSAFYTYQKGQVTPKIANVTAIFYSLGAIIVIYLNEPFFIFWIFPILIANFLLLNPSPALVVNLVAIIAIIPMAARLESNIQLFSVISSLLMCATMAYSFARLTQRQQNLLEGYATQDVLTQLGNRRAMDLDLALAIADFTRSQAPACLILLDLDLFKHVNDTYGHATGDKALTDLADILIMRSRKTDRVFRYGGEEFVLLVRNTGLNNSLAIAEQLREHIAANLKTPAGNLTASFGCAQLHENETYEEWFERADKALYRAKQQGRNCVVAAD